MKKINFLMLLAFMFLLFGCRQENLLLETQSTSDANVKFYTVTNIKNNATLWSKISEIQEKLSANSKTITDSLLQGGTILTDKVLVAEKNGQETYTFQLRRTFPTQTIENLILKKNNNNTYSGVLIQYNISLADKILLHKGQDVDLKSKTKIFKVNDIEVGGNADTQNTSRTFNFYQGCYSITYETHPCNEDGHEYGDPTCNILGTSGAAQAPTIIGVSNICDGGDSGNPGGSGNESGGSPSSPNFPSGGGYITLIFASVGYQYYTTEDLNDPNYVHYLKVSQFFNSLPQNVKDLRNSNPDLFYHTFLYFQTNGINTVTKAFIAERLTGLANWYAANNATYSNYNDQIFLNWAYKFLVVENPIVSWSQFNNWFIKGSLDFQNVADVEFAKDLSNLSYDLLIANQNGTLNQLQASWTNWEKIKQKIKTSIAQGTHQTAKIVKTYYDEMSSNPYINNAASRVIINMYIDELKNEIKQTTNMNKDTMNWDDLFKVWLFELIPNPYSSINFTWNSNVINGNNLYNSSTNAVFNFPKGSPSMINDIKNGLINGTFNVGNNMSKYFQYNFTQYYATLSNNNIGIQMLGSYNTKATVISKSDHSAVIRFYISNILGWDSATRFVQTINGTIGIIPNKEIGEGMDILI